MAAKKKMKSESFQLLEKIEASAASIRKKTKFVPEIAIILGTGLGNLAEKVKVVYEVNYAKIPNFPVSTVESHRGRLVFGELSGRKVVVMDGRFHFYEGYSPLEVTFPVRVVRALGAKILVVSNAAGGLNLGYRKGEIVLIEDQINLMGINPLIGPNNDRLGPRFPDMCEPYSGRLLGLTEEAAREAKLSVRRGVYLAITGPNLETRAEYRMMRNLGADLVGMSTVPEVIVAVHAGMEVLGISIVTDVCNPEHLEPVEIKEIIRIAGEAGPRLDRLITSAIKKF